MASTIDLSPGENYAKHTRRFEGIPGIEITAAGRLWATWYSGGPDEGPENYVLLVTSGDQGVTWSSPKAIVDPPGDTRAFDPGLWVDPLGKLWWFWSECVANSDSAVFDGRAGVWVTCCENSDEEDPKWSSPRRIANGIMMNKPTVITNGEWLFPTAIWNHAKPQLPEFQAERFSNVVASTDQGKSFQLRGSADVPDRTCDEHLIVELRDQRLWMTVRTSYGIGESFSEDAGRTWSPGKSSAIHAPSSRFFIRRLQSGRLLYVGHAGNPLDKADAGPGGSWAGRSHLTAWLSEDDGSTWIGGLLLDERKNVSYPDGTQDAAGNIYVIYDRERLKYRDILWAKFREEDILAGELIASGSHLRFAILT